MSAVYTPGVPGRPYIPEQSAIADVPATVTITMTEEEARYALAMFDRSVTIKFSTWKALHEALPPGPVYTVADRSCGLGHNSFEEQE